MTQPTVFISYSHKDEEEKKALVSHLGVLASEGLVDVWADDRIGAGGDWQHEISKAIAQAKVAILLITANFLISDFILNQELPKLLKRHQNEGLVVFPVIAKACAWKRVPWLSKMKVRPKNGRPVWGDNRHNVDAVLADIAEEVMDIIAPKEKQKRSISIAPDEESHTIDLGAPFTKGIHIGEFSIRGCTVVVRNLSIVGVFLLIFAIAAVLSDNPNIRGLIIHPYETGVAVINPPASPTHTLTPTLTPSPTPTSTPTPTLTPSPTPVIGFVITEGLETLAIRELPGTCHQVVASLEGGTEIIILGHTRVGDWLEIETSNNIRGYVSAQYVEILEPIERVINIEPQNCTPTPLPTPTPTPTPIDATFIIVDGESVSGRLLPNQVQEYRFLGTSGTNTFVLMFMPTVDNVTFEIYPEQQRGNRVGSGSRPPRDLDNDPSTGELVWNGGSLQTEVVYRLRILSLEAIEYCLAPKEVDSWTCPQN